MVQIAKLNLGDRDPLDIRIDELELELSIRAYNCLKNEGIETLRELVTKTEAELLRTPNFGRVSLKEIVDMLAEFGLSLSGKPSVTRTKSGNQPLDKLSEQMADALLNARAAKEVYTEAVAKVQRIAKQLIDVSMDEDL